MSLTKLDEKTALIVIDLQVGIIGLQGVHPITDIVIKTAIIADKFRSLGLPVVLVNVSGGAPGRTDAGRPQFALPDNWTDLAPELNKQPTDILITKQRWGAFLGTDLHDRLQLLGVTQVVITGVATSIGVESTARSAYDLGYNVTIVLDAVTDLKPEAHKNSVEIIFPRLAESTTADELLKLLNPLA